ncbi:MAG: ANTAR domain-containing protein [Acidimicrobiia bacterium]
MPDRDELLTRTFVDVADTLVADFDIVEFLTLLATRCVDLFDLSAAGLLLADAQGSLGVAASSDEEMQLLELFELQHAEGPCLDCYRSGHAIRCDDLEREGGRWPVFAPEAISRGFASVYAVPMRLRAEVIGSLNLLRRDTHGLDAPDLVAAQALADVATIGILQHRAAEEHQLLAEQLQYALTSRVLVEQAKGVLAEHGRVDMDAAFAALRRYSRDNNRRLVDIARDVVDRTLPAAEVTRGRA